MKTATKEEALTNRDKTIMLSVLEDLYEITHEASYLGEKFDVCLEAFHYYLSRGHLIRLKRGISMLKKHYGDELDVELEMVDLD